MVFMLILLKIIEFDYFFSKFRHQKNIAYKTNLPIILT